MILTTITWIFVVVLFFPIFAHCGTTLSRIVEFQTIWSWKKITLTLLKSLIKDWYYFLKKLFRGAVFICKIRYIDMWKSIIPLFVSILFQIWDELWLHFSSQPFSSCLFHLLPELLDAGEHHPLISMDPPFWC